MKTTFTVSVSPALPLYPREWHYNSRAEAEQAAERLRGHLIRQESLSFLRQGFDLAQVVKISEVKK